MAKRWNVTQEMSKASLTQVFSGGACNVLDEDGNLLRNRERDRINQWLTDNNILFFDPQIHPDTHGVEYDYEIHHDIELAARQAAKLNLYEVSPHTFGGVTCFEIAADHFKWQEPIVIYYSDADLEHDTLPPHSDKGHPLFEPRGIRDSKAAMDAHYKEFIKNGNTMRKYVIHFARELDFLTVTFGDKVAKTDVVISPERMHATDLFKAVVTAASGERVYIDFMGGSETRDQLGNPLFMPPESPPELEMMALLDQYVDEANELRRMVVNLLEISVFLRVVYTEKSAIAALEELLQYKGLLPDSG